MTESIRSSFMSGFHGSLSALSTFESSVKGLFSRVTDVGQQTLGTIPTACHAARIITPSWFKAVRHNWTKPHKIVADTVVNSVDRFVENPENREYLTSLATAALDIESIDVEKILKALKYQVVTFKDILRLEIVSSYRQFISPSSTTRDPRVLTLIKKSLLGLVKLILSLLIAMYLFLYKNIYNYKIDTSLRKVLENLMDQAMSEKFIKIFIVKFINNLPKIKNIAPDFFEADPQKELKDELKSRLRQVTFSLAGKTSLLEKLTYAKSCDMLKGIILNILKVSSVYTLARENGKDSILNKMLSRFLAIPPEGFTPEDLQKLTDFQTLLLNVLLESLEESLHTENVEDDAFTEALAKLPDNLHCTWSKAIQDSLLESTTRFCSLSSMMPTILKKVIEYFTVAQLQDKIKKADVKRIFQAKKRILASYASSFIYKMVQHHNDLQAKAKDRQQLHTLQKQYGNILFIFHSALDPFKRAMQYARGLSRIPMRYLFRP